MKTGTGSPLFVLLMVVSVIVLKPVQGELPGWVQRFGEHLSNMRKDIFGPYITVPPTVARTAATTTPESMAPSQDTGESDVPTESGDAKKQDEEAVTVTTNTEAAPEDKQTDAVDTINQQQKIDSPVDDAIKETTIQPIPSSTVQRVTTKKPCPVYGPGPLAIPNCG